MQSSRFFQYLLRLQAQASFGIKLCDFSKHGIKLLALTLVIKSFKSLRVQEICGD